MQDSEKRMIGGDILRLSLSDTPCDMLKKLPLIRLWSGDRYLASICNLKITEIIADMIRISQIFYDFKSADR